MSLGWAGYAAIAVFASAYILFALKDSQRTSIAAGAAGLGLLIALLSVVPFSVNPSSVGQGACVLFGYVPSGSPWHVCAAPGVVEWDTLGLLFGLFLLAALLNRLQVFRYLALRLSERSGEHHLRLFLVLSLLSFVLSAFINSITVMVVLAAVTLEVTRTLGISPVNFLLAEISCSNVGGAATFVGDPPNVIMGTYFGLGFDQFLLYAAPLALASLAVTLLAFAWVFQRDRKGAHGATTSPPVPTATAEPPAAARPALPSLDRGKVACAVGAFVGVIVLLSLNAYILPSVGEIGLIGAMLALLIAGRREARALIADVDWNTLAFFFFLFLLVGSLELTGVIGSTAKDLGLVGTRSVLLLAVVLLWGFGLISSVVDNVPLAAAAAPVIAAIHQHQGIQVGRMVYPSAVGTDVGGNGTPIGASANVVGLAIARKNGVAISWRTYIVRAFPIMMGSLLAATAVLVFWP